MQRRLECNSKIRQVFEQDQIERKENRKQYNNRRVKTGGKGAKPFQEDSKEDKGALDNNWTMRATQEDQGRE